MNPFDQVIGYSAEKKELERICDTLKNRAFYEKLGIPSPRGLLLHGEPGVGKTLMAEALIASSGRKAFACRKDQPGDDFIREIKATFDEAAEHTPSIVFLDDMDKFANGDEHNKNKEEYVTVQSCIDEVKDKEVFVLATANDIDDLPESLLRVGRFDRVIEVRAPRGKNAERIISHYLEHKKVVGVDAGVIAQIMDGRSCAELEAVINEAGLYAGYDRAGAITMDYILKACLKTIFDIPTKVSDGDEEDDDRRAENAESNREFWQIVYHEAGHAVVSEVLCPGSVTLISAHSFRGANRGVTAYYDDDTHIPLQWNQSRIISALGGRAATEQKYGFFDLGSSEDLDRAFELTRDLVVDDCTCGFRFHESLVRDSETLRTQQEEMVAAEVERYYQKAREILSHNRDFVEKVAKKLAEKGILTMLDVREIKKSCVVVPAYV